MSSNLRHAEAVLDKALGRTGARPLAYASDYHFALRQAVMELLEVRDLARHPTRNAKRRHR